MNEITDQLIKKMPDQQLKPAEWVKAFHVGFQQDIVTFLLWAYGSLLFATLAIILLQGFHLGGFNLETGFLKWLGAATVGHIAGLLTLTFRAVFK